MLNRKIKKPTNRPHSYKTEADEYKQVNHSHCESFPENNINISEPTSPKTLPNIENKTQQTEKLIYVKKAVTESVSQRSTQKCNKPKRINSGDYVLQ